MDNTSIAAGKAAIIRIERALAQSKAALAAYKSNLSNLNENKIRIEQLENACPAPVQEQNRDLLCHQVNILITSGSSSELKFIKEQKENLEIRMGQLESMLSSLEQDLNERQIELLFSQRSLSVHTAAMNGISSNVDSVRGILSPLKQIPFEIWAEIFRLAAEDSHEDTPSILQISQVCRDWRVASIGSPQLWAPITIFPVPWWPEAQIERFRNHVSRAGNVSITLLVFLESKKTWEAQALASHNIGALYVHSEHFQRTSDLLSVYNNSTWNQTSDVNYLYGIPHRSLAGTSIKARPTCQQGYSGTSRLDLIRVDPAMVHQEYAVHFFVSPDSDGNTNRVLSLPFKIPKSVIIESPKARSSALFRNILSSFKLLESLTLLNTWPSNPEHLANELSDLRYFRVKTDSTKPFNVTPFLAPGLQELHVEHNGDKTFSRLPEKTTLSKLHTLAITVHEVEFCSMLAVPALKVLILYSSAPLVNTGNVFSSFGSDIRLEQIRHLCFRDWTKIGGNEAIFQAIKLVASASTKLVELTFTSCYLDIPALISILQPMGSRLQAITLAYCLGITEKDCENLRQFVDNVKVFV